MLRQLHNSPADESIGACVYLGLRVRVVPVIRLQ